jgi:large subunit ribosomal protein L45
LLRYFVDLSILAAREWVQEAQEIYIGAHTALASQDVDKLHTLVTEKCFPEMMYMAQRKTIHWNFIKSLEPPRVVHAR